MKKVILCVLVLIASINLKSQVLDVTQVIQEQSQWCWTGVTACVLDYYCVSVSQCEIAEYTRTVATWHNFGNTNCCVNPLAGCNYWNYNWGEPGSIQDILVHFGNISNSGTLVLTQDQVISNIQNNRLFIIRWGWTSGGGHFVVGHGLVGNNLYYMDPWFGEGLKIADYNWVVSGADHTWTHTNYLLNTPAGNPPSAAGIITGESTVCQGQGFVTYQVPEIANATSYVWTLPSGATGTSMTNSIEVDFGTNAISGNIIVRGKNKCGEGEAASKAITVNKKPNTPIITLNGSVLHSSAPSGNQWYYQDSLMTGATGQNYTATVNGNYYVIVTLSGCSSDLSNTINVLLINKEIVESDKGVKIYPNPVSNELIIEIKGNSELVNFEILNSVGQVITKGNFVEKTAVHTSNFTPGIYFIKLDNGKTFEFKKIIKE